VARGVMLVTLRAAITGELQRLLFFSVPIHACRSYTGTVNALPRHRRAVQVPKLKRFRRGKPDRGRILSV